MNTRTDESFMYTNFWGARLLDRNFRGTKPAKSGRIQKGYIYSILIYIYQFRY